MPYYMYLPLWYVRKGKIHVNAFRRAQSIPTPDNSFHPKIFIYSYSPVRNNISALHATFCAGNVFNGIIDFRRGELRTIISNFL